MQFSTVATVAAAAAVVSAANTTTVTQNSTTLVTITSCEENACSETVSPALVSTATLTVDDVITEYITWCPLTATTAAPAKTNGTTAASSTASVTSYTGAAAKALPVAGALVAGAAALLL